MLLIQRAESSCNSVQSYLTDGFSVGSSTVLVATPLLPEL